jgi:hypothetical protein
MSLIDVDIASAATPILPAGLRLGSVPLTVTDRVQAGTQ